MIKKASTLEVAKPSSDDHGVLDGGATAGSIGHSLSDRASGAFETVRDVAGEKIEGARDSLVQAGTALAEKLHDTADGVDGMPSRILASVAGGVETVTDSLRGRTLGDFLEDALEFARRNPAKVAIAAAVAGFAVARMLPASKPVKTSWVGNSHR